MMMDRPKNYGSRTRCWTVAKLKAATARDLQKAIRAEAASLVGVVDCVVDMKIKQMPTSIGWCRCVTCGENKMWSASKAGGLDGIDAGHFLASRRNSILFEESGIHPQCTYDNRTGGAPQAYRLYMLHRYGQAEIDRLTNLRDNMSISFERDILLHMRWEYVCRVKAAVNLMAGMGR